MFKANLNINAGKVYMTEMLSLIRLWFK